MSERKPYEQWAAEKKTPDWLVGAAKCVFNWAQGRELTAKEYDAAVSTAAGAASSDGDPFDVKPPAAKEDEGDHGNS